LNWSCKKEQKNLKEYQFFILVPESILLIKRQDRTLTLHFLIFT